MFKNLPSIAFWLIGIIWGSNFIYMKWASEYLSASQVVFIRVLFGFIPVLCYALYLKVIKLEHFKYAIHFFIMSLLGTTVYYYFFVKAAALLLSGVNGALSGSIPLFTFILSIIFINEERATFRRFLGIIVGLLGVVLIAKPFDANLLQTNINGVIYIVTGSLVLGMSFVYAKKFLTRLKIHFAALTTYQLGFALLVLVIFTDFTNITNILNNTHVFLGASIGLGLLGTGLAFILYYYLVEKLGAVNASTATYIPPVVALIIGYFFIGENITLVDILATMLIFSGVFLINKK
ncbi:EamA family transporter [Malaciobacter molluscorum LMG 25693]|uniref:EamA family transporter n=1 Tax=Malaciobacter molluscorum LMG 25693 TaxID=870501 RepID=A0A2G1DJ39_9BACT|nr:DMT family transporter [Malaciobacter molluscorum]AXX91692.1 EamA/RhaT family transporter [Malaciobacter molluscorum LMG 25693]PHO18512.1 EamA family transporter [Malaciobacter molluscorum LMG 25693]RXJ94657.1 EamA family transporter [Malaciobacter molluscorum]